MENNAKSGNPKENFDLLESIIGFCRWVKRGLTALVKGLGQGLVWLFNIHIRYFFVFLILLVGLGIWAYVQRPDEEKRTEYVGSAYVYCNGFDNFTLDQTIHKLDLAIKTKGIPYLMEELRLDEDECLLLKGVRLGVGVDMDNDGIPNLVRFEKKFVADQFEKGEVLNKRKEGQVVERYPKSQKVPDMAVIEIKTADVDKPMFDKLAAAVLDYCNRHRDLQRLYKVYKESLAYTLGSCERQIKMLDSLQTIEYIENSRKGKVAPGKDLYMTAMLTSSRDLTVEDVARLSGPATFYYEDILELVEEKNRLQSRYEIAEAPLTLLSGFVPVEKVHEDYWWLWVVLASIAVTGVVGGCLDGRKKIGAYVKAQRSR